jgi:hypothetical protein
LLYKTLPERLSAVNHCQKFGAALKGRTYEALVEDACARLATQVFVLYVREEKLACANLRQTATRPTKVSFTCDEIVCLRYRSGFSPILFPATTISSQFRVLLFASSLTFSVP